MSQAWALPSGNPGSDGRTDPHVDRQGFAEAGNPGESFFGLAGQERVSRGEAIGAGFWRTRRCQASVEDSLWGGPFSLSKDREVCRSITVCRCPGRRPVRLEDDEKVGRDQDERLGLCSGDGEWW